MRHINYHSMQRGCAGGKQLGMLSGSDRLRLVVLLRRLRAIWVSSDEIRCACGLVIEVMEEMRR